MVQDHTGDNFDQTSGCPIPTAIPQLEPGMTGWVNAHSFLYSPTGHSMRATIELCTGPGLGGTCITRDIYIHALVPGLSVTTHYSDMQTGQVMKNNFPEALLELRLRV